MEAEKKTKKGMFYLLGVGLFAVSTLLFCQFYFNDNQLSENRFFENTTINGINVSHLTESEAENIIEYNLLKNRDEIRLTLSYGEKEWKFKGSDFSIVSDIRPVLAEVMKIGREGNAYEKMKNQNKIKNEGISYNISYKTVLGGFDEIVDEIAKEIEVESVEPTLVFSPEEKEVFFVKEGKEGVKVNRQLLFERIDQELAEKKVVNIEIPVEETSFKMTEEELLTSVGKRSEFSTSYETSSEARKNNVKKALENFNGMIVEPQQEVSFNDVTGARTEENGYKEANIILNGAYVKGAGGGVCQASTTLYNALLLAEMEILEVNHHSLPASYVPLSCDAMVSEGVADLKFKNPFETPVYIKTFGDSAKVTVEIYGQPIKEGKEVKTRAEFVKVLLHGGDQIVPDTSGEFSQYVLYKGEYYRQKYPREGYESKAFLEIFENGELVESKEIRHDFYPAQNGIVIEGTEELGEGMTLPKNEVKIIPPQKDSKVEGNNVQNKIEKERPAKYNP